MVNKAFSIPVTIVIVLCFLVPSYATIEMCIQKTLKMEGEPRDVAVSLDGRWMFVLTDQGNILVYSADGKLNDRISVDKSIDGVQVGPREDILFLSSRKNKTVQVVTLDFIKNINVSGSPFKGAPDAPVVIAFFTDFQ
jgi:hypothetical protein